ncbi:MAG: hypothetical protein AAB449_01070, partial [Patescibacteria group bacterium]
MINTIQTYLNSSASVQAGAERATGVTPPSREDPGIGCNLSANGIAICLTNIIYVVTVGIGSGFAYVAAIFFNFAVAISLNSFSYALGFISSGWEVVRDIANMFFILILVYIAFSIMLSVETVGTMRTLVLVIFIALIVNFSFFFTRVVIDASNILSVQFYNAIDAPTISQTTSSATSNSGTAGSVVASGASYVTGYSGANTKDLTYVIMNALQIQNLFNNQSFKAFTASNPGFNVTFIALTFLYVSAAIFLWLLTIAFITNGIKFLMRVVVLWFAIIASPLAFVAATIPQTKQYFNKWRDILISHSIYPVVFLFIFLVLARFMTQIASGCGPVGGASVAALTNQNCLMGDLFASITRVSGDPGFFATIGITIANVGIRLGFVIAILYIGMKAADTIGVMGAEAAQKIGTTIGNKGLLRAYNVAYKRAGPGMWAGALDRGLQKTRFGSTGLGYELRRYVTKPLAGTTIPGSHGESFTEMAGRQGKEGIEKKAGLEDIQNRKTMQELGEFEKAHPTLDDRYKELQELKTLETKSYASMTADERDKVLELRKRVPDSVSARKDIESRKAEKDILSDKIKTFGKRELTALKGPEIQNIIKYLSDSQLKTVKDIEKFSDKEKKDWEVTWH